ncbi:MAG TPA: hypothetical protein VGH33_15455 [Isosphaeraceae bacterium]|jgi:hypothetical protein
MKSWRMTILGMMGVVVACAAWSAWLIRPTFHAASFAFTTMWTVLLVALLQLRYGRNRAFWFGFVVFGWGYAMLAFAPGSWMQIRPYLLTSHPLGDLAGALGLTKSSDTMSVLTIDFRPIHDAGLDRWFATIEGDRFQRIGHSLAALLHGVAGGLLAVFLSRRSRGVGSAIADHPKSKAVSEDGPH